MADNGGAHPYRGYFCRFPFEHAAITAEGEVFQCCAAFLPKSAGNLLEDSFEGVWNSAQAQEIRRTILDGSYTYCQQAKCPYLQGEVSLPRNESITDPEYRAIIAEGRTKLDRGPRELHLAYDTTCNLACPFCRNDFIALRGEAFEKSKRIQDIIFAEAARDARRIMVSAQGDPFASKIYSEALATFDARAFPRARIKITTNGLLFTPENWARIAASHRAIDWIHVSLNAATPETFRKNQKGGDWAKVLPNLRFIASLRKPPLLHSYGITRLLGRRTRFITLSFIIQQNNYREMDAFVALGQELGVDQVMFTTIFHADRTYSDREFAMLPVHLPNHPEHQEFLRCMASPALREPIAYLVDNVAAFLPAERMAREAVRADAGAGPWNTGAAHEWEAWYASLDADAHKGKSKPMRLEFDAVLENRPVADKLPFAEAAALLKLDETQSGAARALLDELKDDFTALFDTPPVEGGDSPCRYVAGQLAEGRLEPSAVDRAFLDYARNRSEPGSGRPYTEALGRIEMERRGEFYRLLRPGQRKQFPKLPIDSLLNIDTGHEPFNDRLAAYAKRGDEGNDEAEAGAWDRWMGEAGIPEELAGRIADRVNRHKETLAAVFATPAQDNGAAPLLVLAQAMAVQDPDPARRFIDYAGEAIHPKEQCTYLALVHRLDEACRRVVWGMLDESQREALAGVAPASMGDWPTGADPFGEAVGKAVKRLEARRTAASS